MWQLTSMAVCCGLVSFVVCVLLVVAVSAVSWFSWRSDGPCWSEDSIRIDFRQKTWQSTSIVACFGLISPVVCVLLVVAIYDMNWGGENDDDGMDEEEEERVTIARSKTIWIRKHIQTGKDHLMRF